MDSLRLLVGKDIGVTGVEDGHGAAAEELTASSAELNLCGENGCVSQCIYPPKSTGDFFAGYSLGPRSQCWCAEVEAVPMDEVDPSIMAHSPRTPNGT